MVVSNMDQIATKYGVRQQQHTDDTQHCISISRINTSQLNNLKDCLFTLFYSFSHNGFSLIPGKKPMLLSLVPTSPPKSLSNISIVNVSVTSVPLSNKVKILGVTLDSHLTLSRNILQVYHSTHFHTRALCHIRNVISNTSKSTAQVLQSLRQRYNPTTETSLATY